MQKQTFAANDIVTVQMGNSSDTYDYREFVECRVVGVNDSFGMTKYLVQEVADESFFGVATVYPEETKGQLYCTNADSFPQDAGLADRLRRRFGSGFAK